MQVTTGLAAIAIAAMATLSSCGQPQAQAVQSLTGSTIALAEEVAVMAVANDPAQLVGTWQIDATEFLRASAQGQQLPVRCRGPITLKLTAADFQLSGSPDCVYQSIISVPVDVMLNVTGRYETTGDTIRLVDAVDQSTVTAAGSNFELPADWQDFGVGRYRVNDTQLSITWKDPNDPRTPAVTQQLTRIS